MTSAAMTSTATAPVAEDFVDGGLVPRAEADEERLCVQKIARAGEWDGSEDAMKMVAVVGRRSWMSLSLAGVIAVAAFGAVSIGSASAATARGPVGPSSPHADAVSAKAEILILHGTNDGSGIDPKIGNIPELGQPPFSSYNSYHQLDRGEVKLDKGAEQDRALPDGSKLAVTLKDAVKDKDTGEQVYVLSMSIDRDGKSFLPSLEVNAKTKHWFFVAGQKYKGGILVIGVRVL